METSPSPPSSTFDTAYWASLSPALLAAASHTSEEDRLLAAQALAAQGVPVDVQIVVWGWDPWKVMSLRQAYGYTWVPALGQPNLQAAPGASGPGITPYNPSQPWPGSIKVSLSVADYPAFAPPAPPPAPATLPAGATLENGYVVNVGPLVSGNIYSVGQGDNTPAGFKATTPEGILQKVGPSGPFGFIWYVDVAQS